MIKVHYSTMSLQVIQMKLLQYNSSFLKTTNSTFFKPATDSRIWSSLSPMDNRCISCCKLSMIVKVIYSIYAHRYLLHKLRKNW